MTVFDRAHECLSRADLEQLQLERLQALIARLKRNVRRARDLLGDRRVTDLSGLAGLPLTAPADLVAAFPYGMFALPLHEVIRLHSTVGPDGRQLVIGHTRNDLTLWGRLVARQLAAAGVTANDVVQLGFGGSLAKQASGYQLGAELLGASLIPEDPLHIDYQLAMLQNYRVTVLVTTPANATALARLMEARRIDPQALHLRAVLLSRPVDDAARQALSAGLFATVRCNFGVAEVLNPGLCVECPEGRFHVNEDQFLVESVDGELVVTTLCREAIPLLRYRTRQAVALSHDRCACGRTGVTLTPGVRLDDRLRVGETDIYPAQIHEVLGQTRASGQPYRFSVEADRVIIAVEITADLMGDTIRTLMALQYQIETEFFSRLGVAAEVRLESMRPRA
jgi:phenylacetate-CoA ligase